MPYAAAQRLRTPFDRNSSLIMKFIQPRHDPHVFEFDRDYWVVSYLEGELFRVELL